MQQQQEAFIKKTITLIIQTYALGFIREIREIIKKK